MARVEFSKKVRAEAFLRCGGKCQKCEARLKPGEGEYDHIVPYHFTQDSTISNCQVLCVPCHRGVGGKTSDDQADIAKCRRIAMKHNGSWPASKAKIRSGGFRKTRDV